jgi:asparagine synthase (glutamine-hydrolysing)
MCGICGIVSARGLRPEDARRLRAVNRAQTSRGPDGAGEFFSGGAFPSDAVTAADDARVLAGGDGPSHAMLAMRRLSIIDLTGGWQPLFNEDRSLALVCNGEVYNFVELRRELEGRGHRFATKSDCETILHLYEEHGPECLKFLRGMYAFALWDSKRRRLLIGRDRMGEKPLYLFEDRGDSGGGPRLLFASEMKAILASGLVPFELDPVGVNLYMHYHWVPEPHTAVKGVRKLAAGHYLLVDVDPWRVQERCYWRMEDAAPVEGDPATLIRAELETISEQIIRSDVPVGVALSGGVDSSLIACLAARKYPGTMHAFSVGYRGRPRQDERAMAKALADHLGMPMHEIEIDPGDVAGFFPELCYLRDDPISDIAGHGYYHLNRAAREAGCPVLLQGHGGDELFWGYSWCIQAAELALRKSGQPMLCGGSGATGLERWVPRSISPAGLRDYVLRMGQVLAGWRRLGPDPQAPPEQLPFYDMLAHFQAADWAQGRLFPAAFRETIAQAAAPHELFRFPRPWNDVGVLVTKVISESYMMQVGLAQGDRLSMASSVELRLPLVDYKLVELVIGLRKTHPDHHLGSKRWLKDAVKDVLPEWVMNRRKRGFNPPGAVWGRQIMDRYGADLESGYLVEHGALTPQAARSMAGARSRFSPWSDLGWKALVLEMWARRMAAQASVSAAAFAAPASELVPA